MSEADTLIDNVSAFFYPAKSQVNKDQHCSVDDTKGVFDQEMGIIKNILYCVRWNYS